MSSATGLLPPLYNLKTSPPSFPLPFPHFPLSNSLCDHFTTLPPPSLLYLSLLTPFCLLPLFFSFTSFFSYHRPPNPAKTPYPLTLVYPTLIKFSEAMPCFIIFFPQGTSQLVVPAFTCSVVDPHPFFFVLWCKIFMFSERYLVFFFYVDKEIEGILYYSFPLLPHRFSRCYGSFKTIFVYKEVFWCLFLFFYCILL